MINIEDSRYSAPSPIVKQIDRGMYPSWASAPRPGPYLEQLTDQILEVLYTVRCNTVHGGKDTTDDNAIEVVENAYRLVRTIVDRFLVR